MNFKAGILCLKPAQEDNMIALRFLSQELSQLLKRDTSILLDQATIKHILRHCNYGQSKDLPDILTSGFCIGSYYRTYIQESIQNLVGSDYIVDLCYNETSGETTYTLSSSKEILITKTAP